MILLHNSKAKAKATQSGAINKGVILQAVYDTVAQALPRQDNKAVREIVQRYHAQNDRKISLDVFLEAGVGVCHHDALTYTVILELFRKAGIVESHAGVDRNSTYLSNYAWCRYTNSAGTAFILDVLQGYKGQPKDAIGKDHWAYQRPEDF